MVQERNMDASTKAAVVAGGEEGYIDKRDVLEREPSSIWHAEVAMAIVNGMEQGCVCDSCLQHREQ